MTVGELIAKLQMYDKNTPILVVRDGKTEVMLESDITFQFGTMVVE